MRPTSPYQSVTEALQLWRQAELNGHEVGVDKRGELVYVNTARRNQASPGLGDRDQAAKVLTAKIENELSQFAKSMTEIRERLVPNHLASLKKLPERGAIQDLNAEWQQFIRVARPAEDTAWNETMARREKFVETLKPFLPGKMVLGTKTGEVSAATFKASANQARQVLKELEESVYAELDPETGVTRSLHKDCHRQSYAIRYANEHGEEKTEALFHRPATDVIPAMQSLFQQTLGSERTSSSSDEDASDTEDVSQRNFVAILSRVMDQTLLIKLDELKHRLFFGNADSEALFNPQERSEMRTISINPDGMIRVDISALEKWNQMIVQSVSQESVPINDGPLWEGSLDQTNFSYRLLAQLSLDPEEMKRGEFNPRFERLPEFSVCIEPDWKKIDRQLQNLDR